MPTRTMITDIMNRNVSSISLKSSLQEVCRLFVEEKCHYLPVLDETGQLVGLLSTLAVLSTAIDVVEAGPSTRKNKPAPSNVGDLMKIDPFYIQAEASVQDALDLFENNQCWALPVLSGGQLVGMVTSSDLVNYFTHLSKFSLDL